MWRALACFVVLAAVTEARADPFALDVGVEAASARYNDGASLVSGDDASFVAGGVLCVNIGFNVERDVVAFFHASVSTTYPATWFIPDPVPPNEFPTSFRVYGAGVGVEKMLLDRLWAAAWLGAIHVSVAYGGWDRDADTLVAAGIDLGFDLAKLDNHSLAVTAGVFHGGSWSLDQNRDGVGVYVFTAGIEYRLR